MRFHFTSSEHPEAIKAFNKYVKIYGQADLDCADTIIAIGGDGMLLKALRNSIKNGLPVFGINRGNIGFLMNENSFENLNERVLNSEVVEMSPLKMIVKNINNETLDALAINEVSLLRQTHQAAHLKIFIDKKERLKELVCDGIITSTPIGSTAYNLSAHGPILPLNANILALTPISSFRPRRWKGALLSEEANLKIEVMDYKRRPVSATADNFEVINIKHIKIGTDKSIKLKILHDPGFGLDEKIMKEQFQT